MNLYKAIKRILKESTDTNSLVVGGFFLIGAATAFSFIVAFFMAFGGGGPYGWEQKVSTMTFLSVVFGIILLLTILMVYSFYRKSQLSKSKAYLFICPVIILIWAGWLKTIYENEPIRDHQPSRSLNFEQLEFVDYISEQCKCEASIQWWYYGADEIEDSTFTLNLDYSNSEINLCMSDSTWLRKKSSIYADTVSKYFLKDSNKFHYLNIRWESGIHEITEHSESHEYTCQEGYVFRFPNSKLMSFPQYYSRGGFKEAWKDMFYLGKDSTYLGVWELHQIEHLRNNQVIEIKKYDTFRKREFLLLESVNYASTFSLDLHKDSLLQLTPESFGNNKLAIKVWGLYGDEIQIRPDSQEPGWHIELHDSLLLVSKWPEYEGTDTLNHIYRKLKYLQPTRDQIYQLPAEGYTERILDIDE